MTTGAPPVQRPEGRFSCRARFRSAKSTLATFLWTAGAVFIAVVATIAFTAWRAGLSLRFAFERHVHYRGAPFRSVRGGYVLVLRSFTNRMAIGRRVRRIFRDEEGREIDPTMLRESPELQRALRGLAAIGHRVELGDVRPDLTLLTFLGDVRARYGENFVGVSNGSSLGGVLRLVHAPDDLWFPAMRVLAAHAKAILIIPDDSVGLLREVQYVLGSHPGKVAFVMPPSDSRVETRWDAMKEYRFEGIDMSGAWLQACNSIEAAGVSLPAYDASGGLFRCHGDGSVCEVKWGWSSEELMRLIATIDPGTSSAEHARKGLREIGVRSLRYKSPPGILIDDAWYERAFHEDFHVRDPGARARLDMSLPWLGLRHRDHVMNAALPGAEQPERPSAAGRRCKHCPPLAS